MSDWMRRCAVEDRDGIPCPDPVVYIVKVDGEVFGLCERCYGNACIGFYGDVSMQVIAKTGAELGNQPLTTSPER